MNCQRCGAPLVPGNAFCGSCGAPAAAQQPQGYGAPPPPPPQGYPPQQYPQQYPPQQFQQPYPQAPQPYPQAPQAYAQPQYAAPQPGYGGPVGYQPVGSVGWVLAGYIFAFAGGFLGLGIGGYLWGAKVDDPYGNKVKKFKGGTRAQGVIIMIISGFMMAFWKQLAGG